MERRGIFVLTCSIPNTWLFTPPHQFIPPKKREEREEKAKNIAERFQSFQLRNLRGRLH
jgi:hypothetical protein